jgi:hypothetical protein
MKLFGKLFRRKRQGEKGAISSKREKQLAVIKSDVLPMPELKFWKLVAACTKKKKSLTLWQTAFEKKLSKLTLDDLVAFQLRMEDLLLKSYLDDLWCACAIVEGTAEEIAFEGFRCWIIAHGSLVFGAALKDPDSIANLLKEEAEDHYFPALKNLAPEIFRKLSGKSMSDVITLNIPPKPVLALSWSLRDADSMKAICPRLWEYENAR